MMRRHKRGIDIDAMLGNALIVLLILCSVISMVLVRDFLGYAWHEASGGSITKLDVRQQEPAIYWYGLAGIAIQNPGFLLPQTVSARNARVEVKNFFFDCMEPGAVHELYITTATPGTVNWFTLRNASAAQVDAALGIPADSNMSTVNTFRDRISISLGNRTISNIPAAYTKKYNSSGSKDYYVGLLTDGTNLVYVTKIYSTFSQGYAPLNVLGFINYQMMVPVSEESTITYYAYTDPFDICPEGADEGRGKGSVWGYVKDNTTGIRLSGVSVFVGTKGDVTDANGFYNVTDIIAGSYMIVGLKQGFLNYVSNITVYEDEGTHHNISMALYVEPQTGTGSGIGTGVDNPGDQTQTGTGTGPGVGPGVGPGIGPGVGPFTEKPVEPGMDHWVSLDRLYKKIRLGNFFEDRLVIYSFREEPAEIQIKLSGNVTEIGQLDKTSLVIEQNKYDNVTIRILGSRLGIFDGSIDISGDFNETIPVRITVTDEDKLPVEALLMQLELLSMRPFAGDMYKFRLNLHNLLIEERYNVSLRYTIIGAEEATANYSLSLEQDNVPLLTSMSLIKQFKIPADWSKGDYKIIIDASYLDLTSQAVTQFTIYEPLYMYSVFGLLPLWKLLLGLFLLTLLILIAMFIRKRIEAQKRYHVKVEYKLLPKKGPRSLYVGQVAETTNDAYFDMDVLTVHTIVAGSTGGGKTISAQVIIEECLLKDVAVIVFDPTAQWTGMLRKCDDQKMFAFYPRFHQTPKDAKGFSGNIKAIKNPREKLDIFQYMKPGEIQVITLNTLKPNEIDVFVANTVRTVFSSNLQEYRGLRMMMVYDEVHRLLPKFGGSGEGFIQIERACREFRKWGIGVMLVSQVLADFVGQIKANINTEIQMKTRDEGDLGRIKDKFGASYVQELVKSPVGSGMVQNSAWNRGRPYYITFRPILHSVKRLTDEELENYNKYNNMVDDLKFQLDQLEKEGVDVFDLRLELKLSVDKIKTGSFNMVEIYLEGLRPRIEKHWTALGKKPTVRKMEMISEEDIQKSLDEAKKEREEFEKKNAASAGPAQAEKKGLGYRDDVPPDKILNLSNGMIVINLASLFDEVSAMKDEDFAKHVNDSKNDFADWIRTAVGNEEWAKAADKLVTKEDYLALLDAIPKNALKTFKPKKVRESQAAGAGTAAKEQPGKVKNAESAPQVPAPKPEEQKKADEKTAAPKSEAAPAKAISGLNWDEIKAKLAASKSFDDKIKYLLDLDKPGMGDSKLKYTIAAQYHRNNSLDNAIKYYGEAIRLDPGNLPAKFYLAGAYKAKGDVGNAIQEYEGILKADPAYPNARKSLDDLKKANTAVAGKST